MKQPTSLDDNAEKPPEKQELVRLNFTTQRGVILLNVDPAMAPNDLRERPLTEAARAIVRSGDGPLTDAIRKVSPRMFGDFARTLPPPRKRALSSQAAAARRDRHFRHTSTDGESTRVSRIAAAAQLPACAIPTFQFTKTAANGTLSTSHHTPATEPFNLVLLLDVSGSVEERIDFIRQGRARFSEHCQPAGSNLDYQLSRRHQSDLGLFDRPSFAFKEAG